MQARDVDFKVALEIITHPHDLSFVVSGDEFVIARGPDKDRKQKVLVSSRDLKKKPRKDPIECIKYYLNSFVEQVEGELRSGRGSFFELINPEGRPFEDLLVLRDKDIDLIINGLKEDSPNGTFETFRMNL